MRIKAVNGFYDADLGRIVEKGEMVDFSDAKSKRLIALKLVIALPGETPQPKKTRKK